MVTEKIRSLHAVASVGYDGDYVDVYIHDFPMLFRHGGSWIAVPETTDVIYISDSLRNVLAASCAVLSNNDVVVVDRSTRYWPFRIGR